MRKLIILILAFAALIALSSCKSAEKSVKVALLVSEPGMFGINPFYVQAWDSIVSYCDEHNITYSEYISDYRTVSQLQKILDEAVAKGAEFVVAPGYYFQEVILEAQNTYPDVNFVLLDCVPNNGMEGEEYYSETGKNTLPVLFAEEQNGFLAGYAIVMDGYRGLGFFGGMSVPAVMRVGYGYVQGAEYAAKQLGLGEGEISLRYAYAGSFAASPEIQAKAGLWYGQGTEVILACGGSLTLSMAAAAEKTPDKYVIGIDMDESGISERIVTSALKHVDRATTDAITKHFEGNFPGGTAWHMSVADGGIGLEIPNSRFRTFDAKDYGEIVNMLKEDRGGLASGIIKDDVPIEDIPLDCVDLRIESMD